jgi:hypothetical protein
MVWCSLGGRGNPLHRWCRLIYPAAGRDGKRLEHAGDSNERQEGAGSARRRYGWENFAHPQIEWVTPLDGLARPTGSRSKFDPRPDQIESDGLGHRFALDCWRCPNPIRVGLMPFSVRQTSPRRNSWTNHLLCPVLTLPRDAADQVMDLRILS